MQNNKINILGINISNVDMAETLKIIREACGAQRDTAFMVCTPNAEMIMKASRDTEFADVLNSANLCIPDGIGVIWASKLLKTPLTERVAGCDTAMSILRENSFKGVKVFFLGGRPGVAEQAAVNMKDSAASIVGTHHGYFKDDEAVIRLINASEADILFVCFDAGKQEKWIYKHRHALKGMVCLGLGGTLDILSGNVKRAPALFIKLNLEWFYRLLRNPSRIKRYMDIPRFMIKVFRAK